MPKLDIDNANERELCRALAEKPCPCRQGAAEGCETCRNVEDCLTCQGTGVALPWASEECPDFSTMWPSERELHSYCKKCSGSGRVPKALGLELFLALAAPDGAYIVDVETNWDCPHVFPAGEEENEHMVSPCDESTFACMVTRGRETAYELFGQADGLVLDKDLLMLATLRAVAKAVL